MNLDKHHLDKCNKCKVCNEHPTILISFGTLRITCACLKFLVAFFSTYRQGYNKRLDDCIQQVIERWNDGERTELIFDSNTWDTWNKMEEYKEGENE